ncbi:plasmid mobilization relaxosome protein MobC [Aliarcobacter butzleri]
MIYKQVKINLTPSHYSELETEALNNGMSIAQLVRHKLGIDLKDTPKALQRPRKVRSDKKEIVKADPQLLYHLSKIGTNLNQISKHLNSNNAVDRVVLTSLIEVQEELKKLK